MTRPDNRSSTSSRALLTWWAAAAAATIAATLMIAGPALATVPAQAFDDAFQQFQHAAAGETKAIESAAEQFGRLAVAEPADPALIAYTGAATVMRSMTTMLPWRKLSFAEDGLAQIDKALAMLSPEHDKLLHRNVAASLETRFVAANTFLRVPAMFNRNARGTRLLDEVLKSPLLATAPEGFRAAVAKRAAEEAAKVKP
jgi:hypothetical protein